MKPRPKFFCLELQIPYNISITIFPVLIMYHITSLKHYVSWIYSSLKSKQYSLSLWPHSSSFYSKCLSVDDSCISIILNTVQISNLLSFPVAPSRKSVSPVPCAFQTSKHFSIPHSCIIIIYLRVINVCMCVWFSARWWNSVWQKLMSDSFPSLIEFRTMPCPKRVISKCYWIECFLNRKKKSL